MKNTLLIEILSEELPPHSLFQIRDAFSDSIIKSLSGFLDDNYTVDKFISPRRFGLTISNINKTEKDKIIKRKGPALSSALINNEPSKALQGFIKSTNSKLEELVIGDDGYYYYNSNVIGKKLEAVITNTINDAIKAIPIAKAMRWADNNYSFIRPLHNIVLMYNNQVLDLTAPIMGLTSSNKTLGHRFMSNGYITIANASQYNQTMLTHANVVPSYEERINTIKSGLEIAAKKLRLQVYHSDGLLEEVAALVEYPVVLVGEFSPEFLEVPQECLILSMAKNQKYFALVDANNKMNNKFLFVSNIDSVTPEVIVNGNQKVLAARLTDAKFFYDFDRKTKLIEQLDKLQNVVYHNKIGTQYARIERLNNIATQINQQLHIGLNSTALSNAIKLSKADLVTEMVGEFPELQGTMGKYYALHDGYSNEIANAIESHYQPRFSGDALPSGELAQIVALVDKLEILVGIFGIGLIPTGDRDPFALRRTALGVIRILLDKDLSIIKLLDISYANFYNVNLAKNVSVLVYEFILSRLSNYLNKELNYPLTLVNAVIDSKPTKFNHIINLLDELTEFSKTTNSKIIIASNKRIDNILRKNNIAIAENNLVSQSLLENEHETNLFDLYTKLLAQISAAVTTYNYADYFSLLGKFADSIDSFFTNVMVMTDNVEVQQNRINLLLNIYIVFNQVIALTEINL